MHGEITPANGCHTMWLYVVVKMSRYSAGCKQMSQLVPAMTKVGTNNGYGWAPRRLPDFSFMVSHQPYFR